MSIVSYNHNVSKSIPGSDPLPATKPGHTDDITAVADLLHQLNRRIRHFMTGDGATDAESADSSVTAVESPVSMGQIRALRQVRVHHGPMRMSELAEQLNIARRSATTVVDTLVDKGLLVRSDDPDDRRSVLVSITEAGLSELSAALARRRTAAAQALESLNPTDLAELRRLLTTAVTP